MKTQSSDTSPEAERVQIALLRAASPGRRLALANALSRMALQLSAIGLRRAHPGASRRELAVLSVAHTYGQTLSERVRLRTEGRVFMPVAPDLYAAMAPVLQAFEQLGVAYYVGGSVASSVYGMPRATLGVDLVADLNAEQIQALVQRLQDAYYISEDAALDAVKQRSSFNVIHLPTMLKLDIFVRKARAFDDEAFRRARQELVDEASGLTLTLPSPEDILLAKLEWYRQGAEVSDRQWSDILGILKVQGAALDLPYARHWASSLGVADLLARALGEAGLSDTADPQGTP
jgi:hypothetical protein